MIELASRLFGHWVRLVDRDSLRADAIAGLLGALLVLPQSFAFATLAGLPPEYGLYTAVVPCAVAALFGSSWHVLSGPTNANSLALFATLAPLAAVGSPAYIQLALAVTVLVGLMQFLIGTMRLGTLANFISPSALRGFTGGAAALIVLHSLTDLLGLPAPSTHGVPALLAHLAASWSDISLPATAIGLFAVVAPWASRRLLPRWPFMVVALVASTALSSVLNLLATRFDWSPVDVVGRIPPIWLHWQVPDVALRNVADLVGIAFALTIVALGQSISIAKAVAERSGQAIDANREFRGQGLSNIVGGFFSSYVSCGSLNRSMPNLEAGARTPLAALFASGWLLLLVAVSAPVLAFIPMPAIAGLLVLIAWSLFDLPGWKRLWALSRQDFVIAAATFVATVTIRLEMAILLGTMLSLVTYLYRTSKPYVRIMGFDSTAHDRPFVVLDHATEPLPECPQLKLLRIEGDVYFGAVPFVSDTLLELRAAPDAPRHLLVMAKSINYVDVAGTAMWHGELVARRRRGGDLYFHRPRAPVVKQWTRTGFLAELGSDHLFPAKRIAIAAIFDRLDRGICATCTARIFEECRSLPPPEPAADQTAARDRKPAPAERPIEAAQTAEITPAKST